MKNAELIARLRSFETDHKPDGWPAIQMRDVSALLDAIEALEATNSANMATCKGIIQGLQAERDALQAEVGRLKAVIYKERAEFLAPIPQQAAEPVHVLDAPLSEDAEKAFADFGDAYLRMEMAMKDGINVHGALSNLIGCQDNLRAVLAAAPQPKEPK